MDNAKESRFPNSLPSTPGTDNDPGLPEALQKYSAYCLHQEGLLSLSQPDF